MKAFLLALAAAAILAGLVTVVSLDTAAKPAVSSAADTGDNRLLKIGDTESTISMTPGARLAAGPGQATPRAYRIAPTWAKPTQTSQAITTNSSPAWMSGTCMTTCAT